MTQPSADAYARALGHAVLNAARDKGMTHKQLQAVSGVEDRSFRRYFVTADRPVPVRAVIAVAEALGLNASELLRRAEAIVGDTPET